MTALPFSLDDVKPRHGGCRPPATPPTNADECRGCAMELVFLRRALAEGRDWEWIVSHWGDSDETVDPLIAAFVRRWNDNLRTDEDRARVFAPQILDGLRGTRGSSTLSRRRAYAVVDWRIRIRMSLLLRLAGLHELAEALSAIPEIVDREGAIAAHAVARAAATAARAEAVEAWAEAVALEASSAAKVWSSSVGEAWVVVAADSAAAWAAEAEAGEAGAELERSAIALLRRACEMRDEGSSAAEMVAPTCHGECGY